MSVIMILTNGSAVVVTAATREKQQHKIGMRDATPLGHYIDLTASDGGIVRSYVVQPTTPPRALLVVLQHMDQRMPGWQGGANRPPALADTRPGVNPHVRQMAEAFATQGYLAIAPSTFSRGHSGTDYGYRFEQGRWGQRLIRPMEPLPCAAVMLDIEAAIAHGRKLAPYAQIGVVGYCWGGLLAWEAACTLGYLSAAVCHYGGGMESPAQRERQPLCPVLAHFPTDARWMAAAGIEAFRAARRPAGGNTQGVDIRVHPGRYGFMQPQHTGYDAVLALRVQEQTLDFLQQQLVDGVSMA